MNVLVKTQKPGEKGKELGEMKLHDLRSCLDFLASAGEMVTVADEVDSKWELAAIADQLDGGPAVWFKNIKGYGTPVIAGLCSSRERVEKLFGVPWAHFSSFVGSAVHQPLPPKVVSQGPVKETIQTATIDLLRSFPIPWHGIEDGGHYITAGVVFSKDAGQGPKNASIHRLQVTGPDSLAICISPGRHLEELWRRRSQEGKPLEIAIAIGVDPAILFAAGSAGPSIPFGFDEIQIAGRLKGEPVELIPAETVDIEIPAHAEIVIEGEILPNERRPEGPFMDFLGLYTTARSPLIRVKAVTHRKRPIFQTIIGIKDHLMYGLPMREHSIRTLVQSVVPTLRAVRLNPGGRGLHCILSIQKTVEGQQRNALLAALTAHRTLKFVIVVDDDIDISNPEEVEWAIATRFQGSSDLLVIPDILGERADPSGREGISAKVGLDATAPLVGRKKFEKVKFKELDLQSYSLVGGMK